jgi:sugar transferase (PEP-CTERM/EpsH1 system associated)
MRVLVLTSRFIWPLTDGGAIRDFNLLRETSRFHDVYLLCFLQSPKDRGNFRMLEPYCKKIIGIDRERGAITSAANALLGTVGSRPYIMREYWRPAMASMIEKVVAEERIDAIHAHFLHMGQYAANANGAAFVLDAHNLEHVLWKRVAGKMRNPLKRVFAEIQAEKLARWERSVAARTDVCVTLSDEDLQEYRRIAPGADAATVPNGVDLEYWHPFEEPADPDSIIYFGNLGWLPQADAVIAFVNETLPRIVAENPNAKLSIVGNAPPDSIRRLASDRIVVTGFVEDIREYIARAAVVVMPLRIGAGTKHRILQALAMKKAIVASSMAAEGMELSDSVNVMIADDSESFAKRVIELLGDPGSRERLGANGLKLMHERYSWTKIYGGLDAVFERAVSRRSASPPPRNRR